MKNTKLCPRCGHPICMHAKKRDIKKSKGCQWFMVDVTENNSIRIRTCNCGLSRREIKEKLRETKRIANLLSGLECKFGIEAVKACGGR